MIVDYENVLNGIKGVGGVTQLNIKFEPYESIQARMPLLTSKVTGKKIVHLGCTDHINYIDAKLNSGTFLHKLLTDALEECIGIDIEQEAIDHLKERSINNIINADITDPDIEIIKKQKWDYLILEELLEHIENPVAFMKQIKENYGQYFER